MIAQGFLLFLSEFRSFIMRKFLLIVFILVRSIVAYSQEYSDYLFPLNGNGKEEFSEVVNVDIVKNTLYSNAQEWIARTFIDYKSVIQLEDKENGKLILKGFSPINFSTPSVSEDMSYTIAIECKNNRYRYTISDITIHSMVESDYYGTISSSEYTHNSRLATLKKLKISVDLYQQQLDSLEKSIQNAKKREEEKLLKERGTIYKKYFENNRYLKSTLGFFQEEYDTMQRIIYSLKKGMAANADF